MRARFGTAYLKDLYLCFSTLSSGNNDAPEPESCAPTEAISASSEKQNIRDIFGTKSPVSFWVRWM